MIELKHLGKIYSSASGSVEALKDVNLTIADGEIFGIIGLSGAGKLDLPGLGGNGDIVYHPVVQRAVRLEFQRAQRVRDALQRVLNGVGKVIQDRKSTRLNSSHRT